MSLSAAKGIQAHCFISLRNGKGRFFFENEDEVWPYKILQFYVQLTEQRRFENFNTIHRLRPRFGHIQSNRKAGHLETQEFNNTLEQTKRH